MSKYKNEDYLNLCALTYFDIKDYQKGMKIEEFLKSCFMKTDNTSVFFKNMLHFLKKQDLDNLLDLKIVDYYNDNQKSGLVFIGFENEEDYYVVFRGSELYDPIQYENGWQDWLDNLEIFLGITKQQVIVYELFKNIHTNKKIHLLGHSKGGNLALFIGIVSNSKRFSQISQIITFNAPQFQFDKIDLYKKRIHDQQFLEKIISIENEMDIVSSQFEFLKQPLFVLSNVQKNHWIDFYESHQIWGFKIEKNELVYCKSKRKETYLFDSFIQLFNENQKKWFLKQCLELSKNKELLKTIQENIERWVIKNEKDQ